MVTAATSFLVEKKEELEEVHLLESGKRLKKINFEKASWPEIQAELRKIDWSPMVVLADQNPTAAQTWLIDQLLPIMGMFVPVKLPKKKRKTRLGIEGGIFFGGS